MKIENYITALTKIDGLLWQAINELPPEDFKTKNALIKIDTSIWQVIGTMKAALFRQSQEKSNSIFDIDFDIEQTKNLALQQLQSTHENPTCSKQMSAVLQEGVEEVPLTHDGKTIKKRKDGRNWVRYYDEHGKQRSVYGRTQQKCLDNLKEALARVEAARAILNGKAKPINEFSKNITLKEWLDRWLTLYKVSTQRASTLRKTKQQVKHLEPLYDHQLTKLTAVHVQEFLNTLTETPRKKEYVFGVLKDALDRAFEIELIKRNPCRVIKMRKRKKLSNRALQHEEEKRFVDACSKVDCGFMFLLGLYQGVRIGEIRALTKEDFDFTRRRLSITKSVDDVGNVGDTKSGDEREIPIFKKTLEVLEKYKFRIYRSEKKIYDEWKTVCEIAGISREGKKKFSTHGLRHTFVTRCAEAGIHIKTCQQWVGHSSIKMTLDIYTHVNPDFERTERKKIDDFDTCFDTQNFDDFSKTPQ